MFRNLPTGWSVVEIYIFIISFCELFLYCFAPAAWQSCEEENVKRRRQHRKNTLSSAHSALSQNDDTAITCPPLILLMRKRGDWRQCHPQLQTHLSGKMFWDIFCLMKLVQKWKSYFVLASQIQYCNLYLMMLISDSWYLKHKPSLPTLCCPKGCSWDICPGG